MRFGIRHILFLLFALMAIALPSIAQNDSLAVTHNATDYLWEFNRINQPLIYAPREYVEGDLAAWPIMWSYYEREWRYGANSITVDGGASSMTGALMIGDPFYEGAAFGAVTYRFMDLFGGFVRPVARLTVGVNQYWNPLGPAGMQGFSTGAYAYAVPEAGLEFVYEGYGVGLTASYPVPLGAFDQANDITGPPIFDPRQQQDFGWDQIMKNIYLIFPH